MEDDEPPMFFTFSGKAQELPPEYFIGFDEGYELAYRGLPINMGKYGNDWGAVAHYGNGFAEGSISGRNWWYFKNQGNGYPMPDNIKYILN